MWARPNGYPMFRGTHGDFDVVVHVVDVPLSGITEVRGIRCTTPVRTVIDVASSLSPAGVRSMVTSGLQQLLLTGPELRDRLAQPDMADHPGARAVRVALDPDLPDAQ